LVVARIAESGWGKRLWATTSHSALVISCVGTYPELTERPRVIIEPLETTARISLLLLKEVAQTELPLEKCWPAVEEALIWLEAQNAKSGEHGRAGSNSLRMELLRQQRRTGVNTPGSPPPLFPGRTTTPRTS
jgi:hypothetical protein